MAYRIPSRPLDPKVKPKKDRDYLSWIHELPCILRGSSPVEAAHLSTVSPAWGHAGRGKSQKASDRWALPLSPELHREQHTGNEMEFWAKHFPTLDHPYRIALTLWGIYCDGGPDSVERARRFIVKGAGVYRRNR